MYAPAVTKEQKQVIHAICSGSDIFVSSLPYKFCRTSVERPAHLHQCCSLLQQKQQDPLNCQSKSTLAVLSLLPCSVSFHRFYSAFEVAPGGTPLNFLCDFCFCFFIGKGL